METQSLPSFENCRNLIYKLTFARWRVMKASRADVEFEDLLSEAYFIYAWCLENYKSDKNSKFTTYLYIQLRGRLKDYYNFAMRSMYLYEDALHEPYPETDIDCYEDSILSKEYDMDKSVEAMLSDAKVLLSYEAYGVLKYILSREWESKSRRTSPKTSQISKKFGYSKEIVESIMGEIRRFWKKSDANLTVAA